jgi:hypothetical protein
MLRSRNQEITAIATQTSQKNPLASEVTNKCTMNPTGSVSNQQAAESAFTVIPHLPPEMRFRIWELALPIDPQIIKVQAVCLCPVNTPCRHKTVNEPSIAISVTQANRGARMEAFRNYKIVFGNRLTHPVLFNFSRDSLHFRSHYAANKFRLAPDPALGDPEDIQSKLRHVIIDVELDDLIFGAYKDLKVLKNLETLTVIQHNIGGENFADNPALKDIVLRKLRHCWDSGFPLVRPRSEEDGNEQELPDSSVGTPKITLLSISEARDLGIAW